MNEHALEVTRDPDHRFELAIGLRRLDLCIEILSDPAAEASLGDGISSKWKQVMQMESKRGGAQVAVCSTTAAVCFLFPPLKETNTLAESLFVVLFLPLLPPNGIPLPPNGNFFQLSDLAVGAGNLVVAEQCLVNAGDLQGQLLLFSAAGNRAGIESVAAGAEKTGRANVAFVAYLMLGDTDACMRLLISSGRVAEAAFMARTYAPKRVPEMLALWKGDLGKVSEQAADRLADPEEYPNMFPDYEVAKQAQVLLRERGCLSLSLFLLLLLFFLLSVCLTQLT